MNPIFPPLFKASIFFLFPFTLIAQQSNWSLYQKVNWEPIIKIQSKHQDPEKFLSCTNCQTFNGNPKIAEYPIFVSGKDLKEVNISSSEWTEVPFWELAGIDTSGILASKPKLNYFEGSKHRETGTWIIVPLFRKFGPNWEKCQSFTLSGKQSSHTQNSISRINTQTDGVFKTGNWVKIAVTQDGVYQITAADLSNFGLNLIEKNSGFIKMYGTGGKMLPEASREFNFQNIPEIPIAVEDGGDGIFNANDRILFYGQEPNSWVLNAGNRAYEFRPNLYSDTSYYFITLSNSPGKRIQTVASQANADVWVNSYLERWVYSPEKVNVLALGRTWYADVFDFNTSKDVNFDVSGHNQDSLFKVRVGVMARTGVAYPFKLKANNLLLTPDLIPGTTSLSAPYSNYGSEVTAFRTFGNTGQLNNLNINLEYLKAGNQQSIGYLNFVELNGYRNLAWTNRNFGFRSFLFPNQNVGYIFSGIPAGFRVWNVSRAGNCFQQSLQGNQMVVNQDTIQEFFAFNPANLPRPVQFKRLANQNLKGMESPNLVIITHPSFAEEANRLADFRRNNDNLTVEVVTPEQVYNEYSSGAQDITAIRNFSMDLYHKSPTSKFRYLLLFGDCSFDYKNRISGNTNFVPTYESPQSLYILSTYASDDYFGILSKNKGSWEANDLMDIGVGRLPAKTQEEAKNMVDKIIHYNSSKLSLNAWRNRYTFVADNGDFCEHSRQANELAEDVLRLNSKANARKLFIGAYAQEAGAGGITVPEANLELLNSIEKGSMIVNYTGHGGETVWADEFLFTTDMINQLENKDQLAFFITATCDFGRHDYPTLTSGAEALLLNKNGGAVGVMTTGRPVGSINNFQINKSFYNNLYKLVDGKPGRMGDALREAKNNNSDKISNRGFTLLGDPSARFAFPEQEVVITQIGSNDTIRGLDLVEVKGYVESSPGVKDESFNGRVYATLFDRPGTLNIVDNDICATKTYPYQRSVLYNGSSTVTNGDYNLKFFVSKDISYQPGSGRILMYAKDEIRLKDGAGAKKNLVVGGLNPNPIEDETGPQIRLFMNDTTFLNGGLVGMDADLLVFLKDFESGIDVTGLGMGHDLIATLDNDAVYVLNDYFQNDEGSYTSGTVRFPVRNLSAGFHTFLIRAWDNSNNSSEASIDFEVSINQNGTRIVKNVKIYPNPFRDNVFLELENAFAGEKVDIRLEIYDIVGQRVTEKVWIYDNSIARPGAYKELAWDGTKSDGTKLPAGTYFCKIGLKSDTDGVETKIDRKIVLIR